MTFDELLEAVREDDVTLDIEGGLVTLHYLGGEGMLVTTELGEVPEETFSKWCCDMMKANHMFQGTAGATISLEPGSHRAFLQRQWQSHADGEAGFLSYLAVFEQTACEWKARLSGGSVDELPRQEPSLDDFFIIRV